jgi:Asp-tRNA(Asn)/Glu-tRNA(Gln) amidotransferase A subunit family amidase
MALGALQGQIMNGQRPGFPVSSAVSIDSIPQMKNPSYVIAQSVLPGLLLISFLSGCSTSPRRGGTKDRAFILYWPPPESSQELRLAVKDLIDIEGVVTTAGSKYVARTSAPALRDAECLELARRRNVRIVGKTNLTEFAFGGSGMNEYFGTPKNRSNGKRRLIPGGSSSGSAVAVATETADVAFGTDTAGSVRVPAACCGILGLKTTFRLVSLKGVFPLSPDNLDTVGPMAKDIPRLVQGMDLLQEGFAARYERAVAAKPSARQIRIGRLYMDGTDPAIDKALDDALAAKHFRVVNLSRAFKKKWDQADQHGRTLAVADAWLNDRKYLDKKGVTPTTKAGLLLGEIEYKNNYRAAKLARPEWQRTLRQIFTNVDFIAVATLQRLPPRVPFFGRSTAIEALMLDLQNTEAVNFAGNPALAIPIPLEGKDLRVTSLQLIGPPFSEAELVNAGRILKSQ